jgi:3-mercaptopyruvate sulfurtransferase SseA
MRTLLFIAAMSVLSCSKNAHDASKTEAAHEAQPFKELTIEQLEQKLAGTPKPTVVDANPREVYDKRHVPGAIWIPFDEVTADKLPNDKSTPLVFYCANTH